MTRITFFHTATSCAASSRVSCFSSTQLVRPRVQQEAALRQVVDLRLALDLHGEQRVARPAERLAQRRGALRQHLLEVQALELAAGVQQLACGDVAVDDAAAASVSTIDSGDVWMTVSSSSSRWYRSSRSRRSRSPSEL